MFARKFSFWVCFLLLLSGCRSTRNAPPPDAGGPTQWKSVDTLVTPDTNQGFSTIRPDGLTDTPPRKAKQILALSGGGMFGAYTAGVMSGWTKSGKRPEFDVVTGISTGALIAPLVFLGPEYDPIMERVYTKITRRDVFTYRSWLTIPYRDAAATSKPLKTIVADSMTDDMVVAIADAHRKGRRLYIGTTNLDTKRFVTWDLGAIACQGGPSAKKLMTDILVASCSLPGIFPPMPIDIELNGVRYTELHCDGGVTAPMFVPSATLTNASSAKDKLEPCSVYVIQAIKAFPDTGAISNHILPVLSASATAIMTAQHRREISNLYHHCKSLGLTFHLTSLPADFVTTAGGLDFDKKEMNRLFEKGFEVGTSGDHWLKTPRERGPGDYDRIRTGNRFVTQ